MNRQRDALRFRITLQGIEPAVWREILVPARYSFWDLHVAIQDAMGWWDSHLHAFRTPRSADQPKTEIGIPVDEDYDVEVLAGWNVAIADYFSDEGDVLSYEYDFGDCWEHEVRLLRVEPREKGHKYPQCVAGERACPPEDCGGVPGYYGLVEVLLDPSHDDHEDLKEWVPDGWGPELFNPARVRFQSPTRRWKEAFQSTD